MNDAAVLFPGQGAQFEGMGRDWCEKYSTARKIFEQAEEILDLPLRKKCWESGEEVHRTDIAQPGILTTSVAVMSVLAEQGLERRRVPLTAGLSLGEYTALWFAGALDFADALRLVRLRGVAMQAASEALPSGMVSLMGASLEQASALCQAVSAVGICQVANLNAPGQIIASGELPALAALELAAKDHGIRRTRRLVVAGGFHSECMRPAARRLAEALASVTIRPPELCFVSNVNAAEVRDPEQIRRQLAEQVCAPVLWESSMRYALGRHITRFLEPAPGTTLAGLLGKIEAGVEVLSFAAP